MSNHKDLLQEFWAIAIASTLFVVGFIVYQTAVNQNYGPLNKPACQDRHQLTTKEVLHCALDRQEQK